MDWILENPDYNIDDVQVIKGEEAETTPKVSYNKKTKFALLYNFFI